MDDGQAPIFPRSEASAELPPVYEFSADENAVFRRLADAMRFVGTASVVLGALLAVFCVIAAVSNHSRGIATGLVYGLQSGVLLATGLWLRDASRSVEQIVTTRGNDIANLMSAMGNLVRVYALQRMALIAAFVVLTVAAAVALVSMR